MAIVDKIVGGALRLAARVARGGAKQVATKGKQVAKNAKQSRQVAKSKQVPKKQRTKAQQKARDSKAADLKAARAAKRQKRAQAKGGIKSKIAGALGTGGIGGLIGSMFGGPDAQEPPTPAEYGVTPPNTPHPSQSAVGSTDDPQIDLSFLPAAMAVSIPVIRDDEEERGYSLSNVVVTEDIELAEEGGYPFIEAGTLIPSRIAEIGTLFRIVDGLRDQVTDLNKQMVIANSNLSQIKDGIKESIAENQQTQRDNERRRDEEAIENKGSRILQGAGAVATLGAGYVTMKAMGLFARAQNIALLGALAMFSDDIFAAFDDDEEVDTESNDGVDESYRDPEKQYADSLESAQEGEFLTDEQMAELGLDPPGGTEDAVEEEPIPEDGLADTLDSAADALSEGPAGDLLNAGLVAGVGGLIASGVGSVAGATAVGAAAVAAAPVLAAVGTAATVAGISYAAGKIIADNTQIDEYIGDAMFGGMDEDLSEIEAASEEEMAEKFEGQEGVDLMADLLGEGMFDMEEEPEEIKAAFVDMDHDTYRALEDDYEEQTGTPLQEAIVDAVGVEGYSDIMDMILATEKAKRDAIAAAEEEKKVYAQSLETAKEGEFLTGDMMAELVSGDGVQQFYSEESTQIAKDIATGAITPLEAFDRMKESAPDIGEMLKLPPVGEVIPISEILEEVPEGIRGEVGDIIEQNVETPINNAIDGLNEQVDTVVDTTIDEKIQSVIVPLITKSQSKGSLDLPSGSQQSSVVESARPNYRSADSFISKPDQT